MGILFVLIVSPLWAACFQSIDLGDNELTNVKKISATNNGNISVEGNFVFEGNYTVIGASLGAGSLGKAFTDAGSSLDLTITQSSTNYQAAWTNCKNATWNGYDNWFLPHYHHILSLKDFNNTSFSNHWIYSEPSWSFSTSGSAAFKISTSSNANYPLSLEVVSSSLTSSLSYRCVRYN